MGKLGVSLVAGKTPDFFKVLIGNFTERLYLPPAFVPYISTEVSPCAQVRAYDGRNWSVELLRTNDYVSFEAGWEEFVEYYNLQLGELLFFQYHGHFQFTVKIFATSALERPHDVPVVETSKTNNEEVQTYDHVERSSTENEPLGMRLKRSRTENEPLGMERCTKKTPACDHVESSRNFRTQKTDDSDDLNQNDACKLIRGAADSCTSGKPSFTVVIKRKPANKLHSPHIPVPFYQTYLKGKKFMNICYADDEEKKMSVVRLYQKKFDSHDITAGFSKFCHENNIEVGDECVFELNSERSAFTVYCDKAVRVV